MSSERDDWRSAVDPSSGRTYWYHRKTRISTWVCPFEQDEGDSEDKEENSVEWSANKTYTGISVNRSIQRDDQYEEDESHDSSNHEEFTDDNAQKINLKNLIDLITDDDFECLDEEDIVDLFMSLFAFLNRALDQNLTELNSIQLSNWSSLLSSLVAATLTRRKNFLCRHASLQCLWLISMIVVATTSINHDAEEEDNLSKLFEVNQSWCVLLSSSQCTPLWESEHDWEALLLFAAFMAIVAADPNISQGVAPG